MIYVRPIVSNLAVSDFGPPRSQAKVQTTETDAALAKTMHGDLMSLLEEL